MSKLTPMVIPEDYEFESIIEICYNQFKEDILDRRKRPKLKNANIYVPINWIEYKAEIFWHIVSLEPKPRLNILPCTNDLAVAHCSYGCIESINPILVNSNIREKCLYRAIRVNWIKDIIELYNSEDIRVQYWEKRHTNRKMRLYLRYQEDENDFIIVLERKNKKQVILITAYPIFFISAKNDYSKDYDSYKKAGNRCAKTGFSF